MTKTISLADDAYETLVAAKRPGESFSQLARRLARESAKRDLFDRDLRWDLSDEDADALKRRVRAWRDEATEPRYSL